MSAAVRSASLTVPPPVAPAEKEAPPPTTAEGTRKPPLLPVERTWLRETGPGGRRGGCFFFLGGLRGKRASCWPPPASAATAAAAALPSSIRSCASFCSAAALNAGVGCLDPAEAEESSPAEDSPSSSIAILCFQVRLAPPPPPAPPAPPAPEAPTISAPLKPLPAPKEPPTPEDAVKRSGGSPLGAASSGREYSALSLKMLRGAVTGGENIPKGSSPPITDPSSKYPESGSRAAASSSPVIDPPRLSSSSPSASDGIRPFSTYSASASFGLAAACFPLSAGWPGGSCAIASLRTRFFTVRRITRFTWWQQWGVKYTDRRGRHHQHTALLFSDSVWRRKGGRSN